MSLYKCKQTVMNKIPKGSAPMFMRFSVSSIWLIPRCQKKKLMSVDVDGNEEIYWACPQQNQLKDCAKILYSP